ncbi:hypothetical protein J2778_000783 [Paraburkholderia graminis]|nr:hypothetical protein [Paraburkholderia graminis]
MEFPPEAIAFAPTAIALTCKAFAFTPTATEPSPAALAPTPASIALTPVAAITFAAPNTAAAASTACTTTFLRDEPRFVFAFDVSGAATHVAVVSHQID